MNERALLQGTLAGTLLAALDPVKYPLAAWKPPADAESRRAMRWPSGISGVDDNVALEGFYGFTCITGRFKLGKSIAAFASAALAAESGTRVIYVDAELDELQIAQRMRRFGGADWWNQHRSVFTVRMLVSPVSLATLVDDVAAQLAGDCERVLVVLDSINRIAQQLELYSTRESEEGKKRGRALSYWGALESVIEWCRQVRRLEAERVGILVTAEENSAGQSKGQKVEYAGDMALRIKGRPSSNQVELSVPFSREGGEGELGTYLRDWERTRFALPSRDESQLRLVK